MNRDGTRGAPDLDPDPDPAGYPAEFVDPAWIRIRPDPTKPDPAWIRIRLDPCLDPAYWPDPAYYVACQTVTPKFK